MIEITQIVEIVEEDGEQWPENKRLIVSSHWNRNEWVVLKLDEREFAVGVDDLEAAIKNATNVNRYG